MAAKRIEFTVSEEELARLDRERGLVPRAAWIKARLFGGELALERALGSMVSASTPVAAGGPAPSRASVEPEAVVLAHPLSEPLTEESVRHLEAGTAPSRSVSQAEALRRYGPKREVKPIPKGDK